MVAELNTGMPLKWTNTTELKGCLNTPSFQEMMDEWIAFLDSRSNEELKTLSDILNELIEKRQKSTSRTRGMNINALRYVYNCHKTPVDPEFEEGLVISKSYEDGGYDSSYNDALGNSLQARARLDYNSFLFINITGEVKGVEINETV